jgi:hypothetical protein
LPAADVEGIGARLEALIQNVDRLKPESEAEPPAQAVAAPKPGPADTLARLSREIWEEFKGLVRIRRLDHPDLPLLTPSQTYFLRENLKLRLLAARLALLQRDEAGFRADLGAARGWTERYFNRQDAGSKAFAASLDELLRAAGGPEGRRHRSQPQGVAHPCGHCVLASRKENWARMMRIALWLLALFAIAVAFTLTARLDQGYVIVVYPPWRLELSFMLALLLLAGLMALAYAALRLGGIALNLSGDLRAWREKRRRDKADGLLLDALRAHLDGDGERARQLAAKAGENCLAPDLARRLTGGARPAAAVPAPNSTPNSLPESRVESHARIYRRIQ